MHLAVLALALTSAATTAQTQAWDKFIAPGLTYRMEYEPGLPRAIHALRFSQGSATLALKPELAQQVVFSDGQSNGRETLSQLMVRTGAIGGVNADYFPFTGDPLGAMVRSGEILSRPHIGRTVFAWGPTTARIARLTFAAQATGQGLSPMKIHGINEECGNNMLVLNTPASGIARSREPALHALLESSETLTPGKPISAKLLHFIADETAIGVGSGQIVLTARGSAIAPLLQLRQGESVSISVSLEALPWREIEHVVGGGPALVRNGAVVDEWSAEGFRADFATRRHPRTAIGATADGDVWLVVIDGRQSSSVGATLSETAQIMQRLGCRDAVNLDGGGSSTLTLVGTTLNRPSDQNERAIANAILIFGTPVSPTQDMMVIRGLPDLTVGQSAQFGVVGQDGKPIPNVEILWTARGGCRVDQGGLVWGTAAGQATVRAWVRGRNLEVPVTVSAPPPPPGKRP